MTKAVVLGGGLAGMLTAAALAGRVDEVTLVERDQLPESPRPRRCLPQGHHSHILLRGGAETFDVLLPGAVGRLHEAGARERVLARGALARGPEGWFERLDTGASMVVCSRDLMDHVIRADVLADERVTLLEGATVAGLVGTATQVTGVLVERDGGTGTIEADLVVDASGRWSDAPSWLAGLGLPEVREDVVDAGVTYVSRWYEAPEGTREDFPGVLVQMVPNTGEPGRGASLLPMEGRRWLLSLFGSRGGEPPTDEAGFVAFARERHHPIIADLIAQARPDGPIRAYRGMPDRRRRFEKLPMPDGFVVIGDAATALNPIHGTGMSLAAKYAVLLRDQLDRGGLRPGFARRVQAGIAKISAGAWRMAVTTDQGFPDVRTNITLRSSRMQERMNVRVARTACHDAEVSKALFRVASLSAPASSLMSPSFLWHVLRGPRKPALTAEQAIAQFPEFGDLVAPAPATDAA
ncbi:NAD(P)/FAD-dependent oxidoreductase [Saccharothrix deserti]|uniref:NAD(P)/FAD-dependent oxidoreductase n=1 Tax=Saccharothrix deserti TaxID=2593674 RepID=UPI00131B62F6|nr:FAD-dependent monooxygenase [Saccharothrix deserti]